MSTSRNIAGQSEYNTIDGLAQNRGVTPKIRIIEPKQSTSFFSNSPIKDNRASEPGIGHVIRRVGERQNMDNSFSILKLSMSKPSEDLMQQFKDAINA
jgi:hypothetical protein